MPVRFALHLIPNQQSPDSPRCRRYLLQRFGVLERWESSAVLVSTGRNISPCLKMSSRPIFQAVSERAAAAATISRSGCYLRRSYLATALFLHQDSEDPEQAGVRARDITCPLIASRDQPCLRILRPGSCYRSDG